MYFNLPHRFVSFRPYLTMNKKIFVLCVIYLIVVHCLGSIILLARACYQNPTSASATFSFARDFVRSRLGGQSGKHGTQYSLFHLRGGVGRLLSEHDSVEVSMSLQIFSSELYKVTLTNSLVSLRCSWDHHRHQAL